MPVPAGVVECDPGGKSSWLIGRGTGVLVGPRDQDGGADICPCTGSSAPSVRGAFLGAEARGEQGGAHAEAPAQLALRLGVERLLARLVAAGRFRPVPYATMRYLITAGGGAIFANPVEAALLGAPAHPDEESVRAPAESVADMLIAGVTVGG